MRHVLAVLALLVAAACGPAAKPAPTKTSIASITSGGLGLELLGETAPATGLNAVYLRLTREGATAALTGAEVALTPEMHMASGTNHSAPVLDARAVEVEPGLYRAEMVFSMPSGSMGRWELHADTTPPGEAQVRASFPDVAVADAGRAKSFSVPNAAMPSMPKKYLVSFNLDAAAKVGLNPVTVTVHQMKDMMTFVPVEDLTVEMTPEMPSMGHGSSGTVAPAYTERGCYAGQVSFSMAGEWKTTLVFKRSDETLGQVDFTTTF